jgi:hypothetical protein
MIRKATASLLNFAGLVTNARRAIASSSRASLLSIRRRSRALREPSTASIWATGEKEITFGSFPLSAGKSRGCAAVQMFDAPAGFGLSLLHVFVPRAGTKPKDAGAARHRLAPLAPGEFPKFHALPGRQPRRAPDQMCALRRNVSALRARLVRAASGRIRPLSPPS